MLNTMEKGGGKWAGECLLQEALAEEAGYSFKRVDKVVLTKMVAFQQT